MRNLFSFLLMLLNFSLVAQNQKIDTSFFPKSQGATNIFNNIDSANADYDSLMIRKIDSLYKNNKYQQKKIDDLNRRIADGRIPNINYKMITLDGKTIYKSELECKVAVFCYICYTCCDKNKKKFWVTDEMPILNELAKEFEKEDVIFISFEADGSDDDNSDEEEIKKFYEKKFSIPVVYKDARRYFRLYDIDVFPHNLIFDKKGKVILWGGRLYPTSNQKKELLSNTIKKALKEKCEVQNYIKNKIYELKDISFKNNRSDILPGAFQQFNALLNFLKKHPDLKIEITGFTNELKDSKNNQLLAAKRAHAISDYLAKNGIEKEKITCKGLGSEKTKGNRIEFILN